MDKETFENNIKKNYKKIQNYLNGDPGVEGFLDSLADLQTDFANYLIEILKTKKYGKDGVEKSNIYQGHIRGGRYKYIDSEKLERIEKLEHIKKLEYIVSTRVLGEKVSINSLLNEGIKKLEELFNTRKSFEEALKCGKLQSIQLDKVILPSDNLPTPTIGSEKGAKEKELSQNKPGLFISTLRELGIYDDDLIIYSGKVDKNMMRENTYYAIFIPRINKTVFLNTGYGEATFVCEGVVSIDKMTTLGKKELQSELGAIKINFFENDIEGWKNELSNILLGKGGKPGKKVNTQEMKNLRDKINKDVHLHKIKKFFKDHKTDPFTDINGNEATIEDLFSNSQYYSQNYKIINDNPNFDIILPSNPNHFYHIKWTEFQKQLGITTISISTIPDIKKFYEDHKTDPFTDINGNEATIEDLFSNSQYYSQNYKIINKELKIKLPSHPDEAYNIRWPEFLEELGIIRISNLEEVKIFYDAHKTDTFTDTNGNENATIEDLFSNLKYYQTNYKKINDNPNFDIILPAKPRHFYNIKWAKFQEELGITRISTVDEVEKFYKDHKTDTFTDTNGNENATIEDLFSNLKYYQTNYKKINDDPNFDIILPKSTYHTYKMKRTKFQKKLGIKTKEEISSIQDVKKFYEDHKTDPFTDINGNEATIEDLFSKLKYYQTNYLIINSDSRFNIVLPKSPHDTYHMKRSYFQRKLWE